MHKYRLYRWNNRTLFLIFLLLSPIFLLASEYFVNMEFHPAFVPSITAHMTDEELRQMADEKPFSWPVFTSEEEKERTFLHGRSYKQIEESFERAPWDVRQIVDHLKDQMLFNRSLCKALFVGLEGSREICAALVIPYKLGARWECCFYSASEFQSNNKDEENKKIVQHLYGIRDIVRFGGHEIVLIIDEMELLSNSAGLYTFLDGLSELHGFFFIGIVRDETKMSDQLKNRFKDESFIFA